MALLRLLANEKLMGQDVLPPLKAITVYSSLRADDRVAYAHEPADIEQLWFSRMTMPVADGRTWTDAWLTAFAEVQGLRLMSFDALHAPRATSHLEILAPDT